MKITRVRHQLVSRLAILIAIAICPVAAVAQSGLSDNVSITLSPYSQTHGMAIVFSSTVTDTSGKGGGVVPTGSVTFATTTGITLGTATLVNGTASVSDSQLPAGTYMVTATYTGDSKYAANVSIATQFSVQPEVSEISATASSAVVGGQITVSVTDKSGSGVGTPSGTVTVNPQGTTDNNTYTGTLSGTGGTATATVTLPAVQAGAIVLKVNCVSADPSFTCYTPINITANVSKASTVTTLTYSPNPVVSGQTATFTASVAGAGAGFPTPTGNIAFYNGTTQIGSGTLNSSGVATLTTSNFGTGTSGFTATYQGDNNYAGSSSSANSSTPSATVTTLTVSPNPPVSGSLTTLTAAIQYTTTNGATPMGNVRFYEDGALIGTSPVSGGMATFTSTTISGTASHVFYAVYAGDANYTTSTSNSITTASATAVATTTTLTVSPNPPVAGSQTTLTATITFTGSTQTPTGNVDFYEDGVLLSSQAVSANQAVYTSTAISGAASHSFYAVYVGDANFLTSTSNTVMTQASTATSATTTTLTVNPNPPVAGGATTLTSVVGYTLTGGVAPTGNVDFYEDGVVIGTMAVSNGQAVFSSTLISGTAQHTFYAVYVGDQTYTTSISNVVVTKGTSNLSATTTTLSVSPNPPVAGTTTTLTAVVGYTASGTTQPTGNVNFYQDSVFLGSAAVTNGTAVFTTNTLSSTAAHTYYAVYVGDTNFSTSTSNTVTTSASGTGVTAIVLTVTPNTAVPYGTPVVLAAALSTTTTGGITGPNGSVTFTLTGPTPASYTVLNNPVTQNTATAIITVPAPTPGNYTVTATCTGSNYSCTGVTQTATLSTVKASTTTTLSASPAAPVAGTATTFSATVTSNVLNTTSYSVLAPTGTVTFYVNGNSVGVATLTGNTATLTVTLGTVTGNVVTAVYSGDSNYNTSTSQNLTLTPSQVVATISLSGNVTTALAGSDVILTATVTDAPTTNYPTPPTPSGTLTFYDTYNGQVVTLGTVALTATGTYTAVAQLSTTGLMKGAHVITAVLAATTTFAAATSNAFAIQLTDYSVTFAPAALNVIAGQTDEAIATVTALDGFTGQVVLGCIPPAGVDISCSFNPAIINVSGTSLLTVTTVSPQFVKSTGGFAKLEGAVTGISLAAMLFGFLLPGARRRRPVLFVLLASLVLFGSMGCTNLSNPAKNTTITGTPSGTQVLSITTSGTDGMTTVQHNYQVQVTVQ